MSKRKKVLTTGEHRKNFMKFFNATARRYSRWDLFNDFLVIAATSLGNNSDPYRIVTSEEIITAREERYLKVINKYSKTEQDFIISMFIELVLELESSFSGGTPHLIDVLGELFQESGLSDQWKGQFFTPQSVSDLAGKFGIGDREKVQEKIAERGYITICDQCCGAGAMIYGAVNAMYEIGLNPQKQVLVVAGDIDERCVLMTYIQCSLYGIPAIVQHKNAFEDKVISPSWFTPIYVMFNWRWSEWNKLGGHTSDEQED